MNSKRPQKLKPLSAAIDAMFDSCSRIHVFCTKSQFYDALALAIARLLKGKNPTVMMLVHSLEKASWPADQYETNLFIGQYLREYALLSQGGRRYGMDGVGLSELENLSGLIQPRSQRDLSRIRLENKIVRKKLEKPINVELMDEAASDSSLIFSPLERYIGRGEHIPTSDFLAAYIRAMKEDDESDVIIGRRLKMIFLDSRKNPPKKRQSKR